MSLVCLECISGMFSQFDTSIESEMLLFYIFYEMPSSHKVLYFEPQETAKKNLVYP